MITVYGAKNLTPAFKGVVRDFRILWALEELGLPYDIHWMDISKGEHKLAPNKLINPFGKVPSLQDDTFQMFESGAAVLYLYERAGKLPQDARARAELSQWCFAALNTVEPPFIEIFCWDLFWQGRTGREWRYPELVSAARDRISALETRLADKVWFLGEFGPADILMTTVLDFGRHVPQVFDGKQRIRDYLARNKARPAYERAIAGHGAVPESRVA
jgi:glutathione S-transferase